MVSPLRNDAVESLPDDGVLRRIGYGRQSRLGITFPAPAQFQFFIRSPQILFNALTVADISNSRQHDHRVPGANRAETNFKRIVRAIASSAAQIEARPHASDLRPRMKLRGDADRANSAAAQARAPRLVSPPARRASGRTWPRPANSS